MANVNPRIRRIGEQIRRELADLIRSELHDPRLTLASMTSIEVSRDLAHARVYVTVVCEPEARSGMVDELNRAAPLLRRELGRRMHIRTVPKLEFRYDEVVEHGARLSALIDAAVASDASRHHDETELPTADASPEKAV